MFLQGGPSDVRDHDKQGCDLARQRVARGGFFRSREGAQPMPNHLTPEELSKELGLDRQEAFPSLEPSAERRLCASATLCRKASIRSITGASATGSGATISWPASFASSICARSFR